MIFLIVLWIIGGFFFSIYLHAKANAKEPFDADTLGQMIVFPLYLAKIAAVVAIWLPKNIVLSTIRAGKDVVGIK